MKKYLKYYFELKELLVQTKKELNQFKETTWFQENHKRYETTITNILEKTNLIEKTLELNIFNEEDLNLILNAEYKKYAKKYNIKGGCLHRHLHQYNLKNPREIEEYGYHVACELNG